MDPPFSLLDRSSHAPESETNSIRTSRVFYGGRLGPESTGTASQERSSSSHTVRAKVPRVVQHYSPHITSPSHVTLFPISPPTLT